jgi:hypothetical protein
MSRPITPESFDVALSRDKFKIIWTLEGIGNKLGCSEDFVKRTLLKHPNSPIHKLGGRYYAVEQDLLEFFRNPDLHPEETRFSGV